jgi:hypothetical protein
MANIRGGLIDAGKAVQIFALPLEISRKFSMHCFVHWMKIEFR